MSPTFEQILNTISLKTLSLTETVDQLDHDPADMGVSPDPEGALHLEVRHEDAELPGPVPVHSSAPSPDTVGDGRRPGQVETSSVVMWLPHGALHGQSQVSPRSQHSPEAGHHSLPFCLRAHCKPQSSALVPLCSQWLCVTTAPVTDKNSNRAASLVQSGQHRLYLSPWSAGPLVTPDHWAQVTSLGVCLRARVYTMLVSGGAPCVRPGVTARPLSSLQSPLD